MSQIRGKLQRRAFARYHSDGQAVESLRGFRSILDNTQQLVRAQTGCALQTLDSLVQLATSKSPQDLTRNVSALWNANLSGYCNLYRTQLGLLRHSTEYWWISPKRDGAATP